MMVCACVAAALAKNSTADAAKGNNLVLAFMVESPFLILTLRLLSTDCRESGAGRKLLSRRLKHILCKMFAK
ncbi:MAG: hypothetical protein IPJ98_29765 [Bryobacterales bacterium]|nr:hypothetical protein [Bryobacterales bacterium]